MNIEWMNEEDFNKLTQKEKDNYIWEVLNKNKDKDYTILSNYKIKQARIHEYPIIDCLI